MSLRLCTHFYSHWSSWSSDASLFICPSVNLWLQKSVDRKRLNWLSSHRSTNTKGNSSTKLKGNHKKQLNSRTFRATLSWIKEREKSCETAFTQLSHGVEVLESERLRVRGTKWNENTEKVRGFQASWELSAPGFTANRNPHQPVFSVCSCKYITEIINTTGVVSME